MLITLPRKAQAHSDGTIPCESNVVTFFFRMARQSTHQTRPNPEKSPRRDPTAAGQRDAAVNRIASHNYFLLEKFETGIVLTGTEVKSIRAGHANLKDSYGLVKDGELWLLNSHIGPYEHGNIFNHAPLRTRKLLVHKDEVRKLIGKTQQRGLTLIPTRMYFKNGKVKVELALAKGKQLWDKRETERRRTADKEAREAIARGRK
jgi:SsrA-binding protein